MFFDILTRFFLYVRFLLGFLLSITFIYYIYLKNNKNIYKTKERRNKSIEKKSKKNFNKNIRKRKKRRNILIKVSKNFRKM